MEYHVILQELYIIPPYLCSLIQPVFRPAFHIHEIVCFCKKKTATKKCILFTDGKKYQLVFEIPLSGYARKIFGSSFPQNLKQIIVE